MDSIKYTCPVCGYPGLDEPPRTESDGGSYEICVSCGFQFGVSDEDRGISYEQWRDRWKSEGCPWKGLNIPPPENWDPVKLLEQLDRDKRVKE